MDPITAAMLGFGALGAGANAIWGGNKKGEGVGQSPYNVISMPTYSHQEPLLRSGADFVQQGLADLTAGKLPQWWQKYQKPVRQGMQQGVGDAYYGTGGLQGRGILDQVRSTGAALGTGPRATVSRENQALVDYSNKLQQIDQYLAGQSLDYGKTAAQQLPYQAAQIGNISPPSQVVGGQPYNMPADQDPFGDLMGTFGSYAPYLMQGQGQNLNVGTMAYNPGQMAQQTQGSYMTVPKSGLGYTPLYYGGGN